MGIDNCVCGGSKSPKKPIKTPLRPPKSTAVAKYAKATKASRAAMRALCWTKNAGKLKGARVRQTANTPLKKNPFGLPLNKGLPPVCGFFEVFNDAVTIFL